MYIQNPYTMPQQVIRVTGEPGARALQMQPNSSILLLDETAPIVWLAQTDGAGYKTLTPYTIEKYTPKPSPNLEDIVDRITRLEAKINESDIADTEQRKPAAGKQYAQQTHERKES